MNRNRGIRIADSLNANDHAGGFRGVVTFGTGRHTVKFIDPFGNMSERTEFDKILYQAENIVPIGAYQFTFDKLFNIGLDQESTLRVGDLNDEAPQMNIGVPRSKYKSIYYNAEGNIGATTNYPLNGSVNISGMNYIFGFMMGDGGAREDNITAIAPDYKRRSLYHAIPFRMNNDGYDIPAGRYFGKSTTTNGSNTPIESYFVKKFDEPKPRIIHSWVSNSTTELDIVDDTVFSSTSSLPIESYVEMNLSLDIHDGRGFFNTTNTTPRINEFGLVSGWYNGEEGDYEALRIFTHFTRPSIPLTTGDSIQITYRLYAR